MTQYPADRKEVHTGITRLARRTMAQVMEVNMGQIANLPGALECPLDCDLRRFLVEAPDADQNAGMDGATRGSPFLVSIR